MKGADISACDLQGAGKWFPRMLQWADRQWRWRNPYTGHVMRYFDDTDIVTQLPDAFNYKPYWCAVVCAAHHVNLICLSDHSGISNGGRGQGYIDRDARPLHEAYVSDVS